jgi:SAM-dependent methyltransferase
LTDQSFPAEKIDTSRPHPARVYNYYLGGSDNYQADREAAERVIAMIPDARPSARANRDFVRRAVTYLSLRGVRQFIDIGPGIPISPYTHEIAREVAPDAAVAYVDNDPIVGVHIETRLLGTDNAGFAFADVRHPQAVLAHPVVRALIDFDRPVGLVLGAVLHMVTDEEEPYRVVAELRDALAPGSYLVLSHCTDEFRIDDARMNRAGVYRDAVAPLTIRSAQRIEPLFDGFDLIAPGLVQLPLWRPDLPPAHTGPQYTVALYGGVGRKP